MADGSLISRLYDFADGLKVHDYHLDNELDRLHEWINGKLGDVNIASDANITGTKVKIASMPKNRLTETVYTAAEVDALLAAAALGTAPDRSITYLKLVLNTITRNEIALGTLTKDEMAANTLTKGQFSDKVYPFTKKTGKWHTIQSTNSGGSTDTISGVASGDSRIYFVPMLIGETTVVSKLGIKTGTTITIAPTARMGIYEYNNGAIGAKLAETASQGLGSTNAAYEFSISGGSVTLQPGIYWVAFAVGNCNFVINAYTDSFHMLGLGVVDRQNLFGTNLTSDVYTYTNITGTNVAVAGLPSTIVTALATQTRGVQVVYYVP